MRKSLIAKIILAGLILFWPYQSFYQNSIYLYGEDATWINGLIAGDSHSSLFPRGSFLVTGVTLLHFFAHQLAETYSEFIHYKTLLSLVIIVLISFSFFLNNSLPTPIRYLLFLNLSLPITQDVQVEVFGHIHNLVWLFPIAIYNLSFCIWDLIIKNTKGERNTKKVSLCILGLGMGGFLFPLCSIINIIFSFTVICYLYIAKSTKNLRKGGKCTLIINCSAIITLILNILIILNAKDRTESIVDQVLKPDLIDKVEFVSRQLLGLFAYLPSYAIDNIYSIVLKVVLGIIILYIYLHLALKCYYEYKTNRFNSRNWLNLVPLIYTSIVPVSILLILYYTRIQELGGFLNNFNGNGYPNRYYISTAYLFTTSICALSSYKFNNIGGKSNSIYVKNPNIKSWITALALSSILVIQLNSVYIQINKNNPINQALMNNIECYDNHIIIEGYPSPFKTKISYSHKWYNEFNSFCS